MTITSQFTTLLFHLRVCKLFLNLCILISNIKETNKMENDKSPFIKVADPSILLPILEKRLPKSCFMYNSVKMYPRFVDQGAFYTFQGDLTSTAWIVYTHYREDDGQGYLFSIEKDTFKTSRDECIKILSTCKLFNWDEPFFFSSLELWLSEMVHEVSTRHKGHFTVTIPCHVFYKEIDECLEMDVSSPDPSVEVKRLDVEQGVKFIQSTYTLVEKETGDVFTRFITKNESGGVYVDGELVCGIVVRNFGMLGSLHTKMDHRRKGYAVLAMKYAFKELAKGGMYPASTVVPRNKESIKLHEKLGCKIACDIEYIEVWKSLVNMT